MAFHPTGNLSSLLMCVSIYQYCLKYMLGYKGKVVVQNCEGRHRLWKMVSFISFSPVNNTSFGKYSIQLQMCGLVQ